MERGAKTLPYKGPLSLSLLAISLGVLSINRHFSLSFLPFGPSVSLSLITLGSCRSVMFLLIPTLDTFFVNKPALVMYHQTAINRNAAYILKIILLSPGLFMDYHCTLVKVKIQVSVLYLCLD